MKNLEGDPLVSVLMTAYNREKYIAEAIESVLASTYTNFELVIVDDCSKDKTVEIATEYEAKDGRVRVYVNKKNLGDYPNRNKAASYAQGKYIKYVDSDDIIYPHGLDVMVRCMERFPKAGFGLSSISDKQRPYPVCLSPHEAYSEHFNGYGHFDRAPGSAIIKKSAFDQVGGFSGKRMIGDNELWFVMARDFPLVKFPRDLVWDRTHEGQERTSDYAKNYDKLRKEVLHAAFQHPDCPFSSDEKNLAIQFAKRKRIKNKVMRTLSKVMNGGR